jgi:hypothetical protein
MSQTYLDRYQAGEHVQVWTELVALGPAIREEPLLSDAQAVAQEMMRRADHNVGLIVQRLRELGYRFVSDLPRQEFNVAKIVQDTAAQAKHQFGAELPSSMFEELEQMQSSMIQRFNAMAEAMQRNIAQWQAQQGTPKHAPQAADPVWHKPDDELREQLAELEERYGPIPLALRMWFEIVGEIDLCGVHPRLSCYVSRAPEEQQGPSSDPLVIVCMTSADELDYLSAEEEGPFVPTFDLAPDACHKSNYSGGSPTGVQIPNAAFDAPLISDDQWNGMYLVEYLRLCFQWGGFPGLKDDPKAQAQAQAELALLTKDLLPI